MKKSGLFFLVAFVCFAFATPAHAWNCTTPGQIRVQVPNGTAGNGQGDGSGQVDTVEGITFECEAPPTAPPSSTTPSTSNSTSSANSAANSSSNSASNSSASSNQSQGQKQNQSQTANGGSATATGGTGGQGGSVGNVSSTSTVSDSGNSSVKNSGNSLNKNTNTAVGGNQSQTSTSSANGNGVGNGNNSNDTTINEPREVASAYAPSMNATAQCFKPFSGGGQGLLFGASFGGGKIDENCARLEASRQAPSLTARCKVFITSKYAKEAHVTLDDCLPKPVVVVAAPPVAVVAPAQPSITINVPPAIVTVIPSPVVAPTPSVVVAAAATHHKTHVPCTPVPQGKGKCVVDNQSIRQ